jgi:glycosyltransferase involved in cell wall biosynthesis
MNFSIVVPIYNVEQYICQCIDSVLLQTYQDFELILVDDGSPDKCPAICDEYARRCENTRVIHQKNAGLSAARNAGLRVAKGNYVLFLDSDDYWLDTSALQDLSVIVSSGADVIVFPFTKYYEKNNKLHPLRNGDFDSSRVVNQTGENAARYLIEKNYYRASAWDKAVKRSLIAEHDMHFELGRLNEDNPWCAELLLHAKTFDWYNNAFYMYRQRNGYTASASIKNKEDRAYFVAKGYAESLQLSEPQKSILLSYYAYEYTILMAQQFLSKNIDRKQVASMRELLNYDISYKVNKVNRLVSLVGYRIACCLLRLFVILKNKPILGWL